MGLGVGIMQWQPVDVPDGLTYEFAHELLDVGLDGAYMTSESQCYAAFTQRQVLRMLDAFTRERGLSPQDRLEVRSWLESLPWIGGWQDALPPSDGRDQEDDYYPVVDNDDGRDGGIIELHFNW